MKRVVLDTNIFIDWLNRGLREEIVLGAGMVRYLSALVAMELYAGARAGSTRRAIDQIVRAHRVGGRLIAPPVDQILHAGSVLRQLKLAGFEVRSASLVADVLIALGDDGHWVLRDAFRDDARVRVEPFDAIELDLSILWADVVIPRAP